MAAKAKTRFNLGGPQPEFEKPYRYADATGGGRTATPAAMLVPVGQQAAKGAVATIEKVATTPIYSRRIKKEGEDRNGEPQEIESEVNITPAALLAGAGAVWLLGLGVGVGQDAAGKSHLGLRERPRNVGFGNPNAVAVSTAEGLFWTTGLGGVFKALTGSK